MKNFAKGAAVALLVLLLASGARAAAPIEINEAVTLALKNNAQLRQLRQELIKADAFKLAADGTLLPSVSASAAADTQREPQTSDGSDRSDNRNVKATLEQVIYSGGKNSAIRAQAPQVKSIARLALADGENLTAGELYARFYDVLLKKSR